MARAITALFDTTEAAERAARDLGARVGGVRGEVFGAGRAAELAVLLVPCGDAAALHEHVRGGGAVLHAEVPEDRFGAAADVLAAAGAADPDEARGAGWGRGGRPGGGPPAAAGG